MPLDVLRKLESSARTLGWHGVSPISAAALAQIAQGFIRQRVESTHRDIFLNLAVPQVTVELGEPPPKFVELLGGKLTNGTLDLLDFAHALELTSRTKWGATGAGGAVCYLTGRPPRFDLGGSWGWLTGTQPRASLDRRLAGLVSEPWTRA